jgi:sugar lactone lactonase YvrE
MATQTTTQIEPSSTLIDGLCFGEGPRWHDSRLWFSDMHDHWVMAVDESGATERIVEVEHCPSGLGWDTQGNLLIVSMNDRRLLRWDGAELTEVADLSNLASFHCNDMVVDRAGRAYVGNFGFDLHAGATPSDAELVRVDPDGTTTIAARDLGFPNGTVITEDANTLIVAESFAARLTAFDIDASGGLDNRRVWAQLATGVVPDGICLDDHHGIWIASPTSNECLRIEAGGEITHRITLSRGAYACMLGGGDGCTLFMLTAEESGPEETRASRSGRIELARAPYPRAGLP